MDAGEAAVSAQQDVAEAEQDLAEAEQDLAEAEQDLAEAEAAGAGEEPPEPEAGDDPSEAPSDPPATVTRVQQAEAEFAAQTGITDETPLVQAAEQFNAAAVALEMAWLQLFADAGCLTDAQQEQAADAVHDYTAALQQDLADAGYYEGEVDRVRTLDAVKALQEANGLPQTGTMDQATEAALRSRSGGCRRRRRPGVHGLDRRGPACPQARWLLGRPRGRPVDRRLTDALMEFQTDLGVEPTGTVDAATIAAFNEALATAQQTPSPSPTRDSSTPTPTRPAEPSEADSASS